MRRSSNWTGRTLAVLGAITVCGCSEGPPTRAELDAIAAMQRLHGQVATNPEGHAVSLILAGQNVHDAQLVSVEALHDLKFLSLEATPVGDAGVAHLAKLTELQSLSLAGTRVTDAGLANLAGLSSLENLDLKGLAITNHGLSELATLTGLRRLYVSRGGPTTAGIDSLESAIPQLHVTIQ